MEEVGLLNIHYCTIPGPQHLWLFVQLFASNLVLRHQKVLKSDFFFLRGTIFSQYHFLNIGKLCEQNVLVT